MLTHYSSLSPAEVAEQIIKCGGLAPIVAMVSSEHDVMQNEALIALTIISSTVKGWICSSICVCVCVWMWYVEPEVQGCGSNCICEKKEKTYLSNTPTILCMALLNFSLFSLLLCSSLLCFLQCSNVKKIQCNSMHKFVGVLDDPHKKEIPRNLWHAIRRLFWREGKNLFGRET